MPTMDFTTAKPNKTSAAALLSLSLAAFVGCAGGSYNNVPGYPAYPYTAPPGQYPATTLPYNQPVLPGTNVLPQNTGVPQANTTLPANNIAGQGSLPYGYPIGTDPTRIPTQLVPQAPGVLPTGTYQPNAYTASNPYPNTDRSTRPLIGWR